MSQGFDVLIQRLVGYQEIVNAVRSALGKTITVVELVGNVLRFEFEDRSRLLLWDNAQSCCEHRYMSTDDDLPYYVGAQLLDVEVRDGGRTDNDWGDHEIQFLVVTTDRGTFSVANHNEHNGYYGGFALVASADEPN